MECPIYAYSNESTNIILNLTSRGIWCLHIQCVVMYTASQKGKDYPIISIFPYILQVVQGYD